MCAKSIDDLVIFEVAVFSSNNLGGSNYNFVMIGIGIGGDSGIRTPDLRIMIPSL
jgi:hypothetical protein